MIEIILNVIWIVGWVASYHYMLRVIHTWGPPEDIDYWLAGLFAVVLGWAWPAIMVCRLGYIGVVRYIPPIPMFEAKPIKPPTTYRERQAEKLDKRADELAQREKWVKERELDLIEARKGGSL
jgi:hypothetical protein